MAIATAFPGRVSRHRLQDLVKAHLDALLDAGDLDAAAADCPRFLGTSETLWEYWIFVFDRRGALNRLAPHIPTEGPTLAASVYDMVLERLLATDPAALLAVVKRWGHPKQRRSDRRDDGDDGRGALYSLDALMLRVDARFKRDARAHANRRPKDDTGAAPSAPRTTLPRTSAAVAETVAELYVLDGQAERALGCLLALDPDSISDASALFALIEDEELFDLVSQDLALLRRFDEVKCADLLVANAERFPIDFVDAQLARGQDDAARLWYLRVCFARLPDAYGGREHRERHRAQARLYAVLGPVPDADLVNKGGYDSEFLRFLRWTSFVPFEEAHEACAAANPPLHDEMVYCLGKMGKTAEALRLLLDEIGSVSRAVAFVEAHDKGLWDALVKHALQHPKFLGDLLDGAGNYSVDVRGLIAQIPPDMRIPDLKAKLLNIFHDRRCDKAIHEAALEASKNDCLLLMQKHHRQRQRGIRVENPVVEGDQIIIKPNRADFY